MGLIYVNFEGLNGNFDLFVVVKDICDMFGCMVMNDEEMVVLIVGGYMFGKVYGVVKFDDCLGLVFVGVGIEVQGFGWQNFCGMGKGVDMIISGLEGVWGVNLIVWSM